MQPIQLKRTEGSGPPDDGLAFGEWAYSQAENKIYIGQKDGSIKGYLLVENLNYAPNGHTHNYAPSNHGHSGYATQSWVNANFLDTDGRIRDARWFDSGGQPILRIDGSSWFFVSGAISDISYKTNINYEVDLSHLFDVAKAIKLCSFDWKEDSPAKPGQHEPLGVIAQDLPEDLALTTPDGKKQPNIQKLLIYQFGIIQQLIAKVEALEAK